VRACNNAELSRERIPFLIGDQPVGWVAGRVASALEGMEAVRFGGDRVTLTDPIALPGIWPAEGCIAGETRRSMCGSGPMVRR
jgi:hypothetical protein